MKARLLDLTVGGRRQDYREKLGRPAARALPAELIAVQSPHAARVRALPDGGDSTTLQSLVVAALQALQHVRQRQQEAMAHAISLGQAEMLRDMVGATEDMIDALRERLSPQGRRMLDGFVVPAAEGDASSWWFVLTETIQALEDGIGQLTGLVSGQRKGSTARTLNSHVVRLLRRQHQVLLGEAEHWIA